MKLFFSGFLVKWDAADSFAEAQGLQRIQSCFFGEKLGLQ